MRQVRVRRHDLRRSDGRRLFVYGDLRGDLAGDVIDPVELRDLHQRRDSLSDTWVAISPARNVRPDTTTVRGDELASVPTCPLCPGGPEVPFSYEAAVFENRWPSYIAEPPPVADDPRVAPSRGRCEVVLYTEAHVGSLATLDAAALSTVVAVWRDRSADLWCGPRPRLRHGLREPRRGGRGRRSPTHTARSMRSTGCHPMSRSGSASWIGIAPRPARA